MVKNKEKINLYQRDIANTIYELWIRDDIFYNFLFCKMDTEEIAKNEVYHENRRRYLETHLHKMCLLMLLEDGYSFNPKFVELLYEKLNDISPLSDEEVIVAFNETYGGFDKHRQQYKYEVESGEKQVADLQEQLDTLIQECKEEIANLHDNNPPSPS